MVRQPNILIVEDEPLVRTLLAAQFERAGYATATADSYAEMLEAMKGPDVDMIVLDLGLPDEDGLVILRQTRMRTDVPILVLTSRDDPEARRAALELGADDFVSKSVQPEEITLRVRNILKRMEGRPISGPAAATDEIVKFAGWRLNLSNRTLTNPKGTDVFLTAAEFDILATLARAPNRVLSRDQLLDGLARVDEGPTERMIDSYISRIRRKTKLSKIIVTVTGVGYRFAVPDGD